MPEAGHRRLAHGGPQCRFRVAHECELFERHIVRQEALGRLERHQSKPCLPFGRVVSARPLNHQLEGHVFGIPRHLLECLQCEARGSGGILLGHIGHIPKDNRDLCGGDHLDLAVGVWACACVLHPLLSNVGVVFAFHKGVARVWPVRAILSRRSFGHAEFPNPVCGFGTLVWVNGLFHASSRFIP